MGKIISLEAQNVQRLTAVRIEPSGNLVVVGGKNGQGKTSTLDCIEMALAGAGSISERPIKDGASKARIVLETPELRIKRTFTPKGTSLVVEDITNGQPFSSPQKLLDKMNGTLTFDPLAFKGMDAKKQAEVIRSLVGLDFAEHDAKRKQAFDDRTAVNRDVKRLDSLFRGMPAVEAPDAEIDITAKTAELSTAHAHNAENDKLRTQLHEKATSERRLREEIAELMDRLADLKAQHEATQSELQELDAVVDGLEDRDTNALQAEIANAEDTNRKVRAKQERDAALDEYNISSRQAQALTDTIEQLDAQKAEAIASADMPVDGLAFDEDGVTYNSIPFAQCSGAEQLRVSVAVGMALNPELRVLLIRDGSLLDEDNLAAVASMAKERDYQVWMERVGKGKECSVIIEDGEVQHGE